MKGERLNKIRQNSSNKKKKNSHEIQVACNPISNIKSARTKWEKSYFIKIM